MKLTGQHHGHHDEHDDHGGLHRDLQATLDRRGMLRLGARLGAAFGALQLVGCGDSPTSPTPTTTTTTTTTTTGTTTTPPSSTASCSRIPQETEGPYPADGSNGPTVLTSTGVVRSDIRSSFAGMSGVAGGVPLNIVLNIVSASTCAPLAGAAVYLWHCDREGRYSLYTQGVTNQNYLRGVQEADANGRVTFQSIYPGCYAGRWPHIHFEVYSNLAAATNSRNKTATSQIALPKAASDLVYAVAGYEQSIRNSAQITLASDNVFSDGSALELATTTGDVNGGITATLSVAI
ncbi:MAG: intradiol ring-cleavage dioxygenase [Cyanobacteria bacterium]|nr:intradiol ring-cleavage dioxygenase [Cyanobacteriota bacterium]